MNNIVYVLLFIAVFPALGLLALYLDRVLPSDVHRRLRKARKEDAEQKAMETFHPPDQPR